MKQTCQFSETCINLIFYISMNEPAENYNPSPRFVSEHLGIFQHTVLFLVP